MISSTRVDCGCATSLANRNRSAMHLLMSAICAHRVHPQSRTIRLPAYLQKCAAAFCTPHYRRGYRYPETAGVSGERVLESVRPERSALLLAGELVQARGFAPGQVCKVGSRRTRQTMTSRMVHLAIGVHVHRATASFGERRYCRSVTRMLIPLSAGIQTHFCRLAHRPPAHARAHSAADQRSVACSGHMIGRGRVVGSRNHLEEA
jgi:hypothetical protein